MILRAIGYDKNNEFSGADWALHVAQTAQQAGVLKNVKGIDLNASGLSKLEGQLRYVTDFELKAISEVLGMSYEELLG